MSLTPADEQLRQALLQSVELGAYPESEDVAAAQLPATTLPALLQELRKARDEVKAEVKSLSRESAPNVDEWIDQAKQLQAEIERSKATARDIVQQAEAGNTLKERTRDAANKVDLLEKEVAFNASLAETVASIKASFNALAEAREDVVSGKLSKGLEKTRGIDKLISSLQPVRDTRAYGLLHARRHALVAALTESSTSTARDLFQVNTTERRLRIRRTHSTTSDLDIATVGDILAALNAQTSWLQRLGRDFKQAIEDPLLSIGSDGLRGAITILDDQIMASERSNKIEVTAVLDDFGIVFDFLSTRLPQSVSVPLSANIIPSFGEHVESAWLDPRVPLGVAEMPEFQRILDRVEALADQCNSYGWIGGDKLKDWVTNAPRTWLAKRREASLEAVRKLLFTGMSDRKTVERVETQRITQNDIMAGGSDAVDAWDEGWDDEQSKDGSSAPPPDMEEAQEDDDVSAWGVDVDEPEDEPGLVGSIGNDDEDAWGWNDEDDEKTSPSKAKTTTLSMTSPPQTSSDDTAQRSAKRELTLKETFTVTLVPDGIMEAVRQVISDAETLADASYAKTPIAPAASALYSLPTLALAMYRAAAPTSYGKLDNGNMLIYNDSSRLADQLRTFLIHQGEKDGSSPLPPSLRPSSRLRLDSDVLALEKFAKRAYGAEMESQRTILRDLLDGAQGFANCTVPPFAGECDSAVAMTVDRLREVYRQWQSVLSRSALLQSLGSLLSTVIGKIILDVEDLGDIGEEESKSLRSHCDSVSAIRDLFMQEHPGGEGTGDTTGIYCPNWFKFQYLAEILESSLADIKYLWTEGELSLEFESSELLDLIQALFADSDYRRRAITDIRRSGRQ